MITHGRLYIVRQTQETILQYIKKHTLSSSELDFGAILYRTNELMESNNDISKLTSLGWNPKTPIELGLLNVIAFEKNINKR